ncbi:MAG: hypothetical protein GX418_13395 [Clostridiales bacterium]|nr:hypothetical protein [Clostridiales bacterium]
MMISVSRPEFLCITDDQSGTASYGGDQAWYAEEWNRMSGCGPTCAANVTAYLARTRPGLRTLYPGDAMTKRLFAQHMEEMFRFVTPGAMGLNRLDMFIEGMERFAASRGVRLIAHVFEVSGNMRRDRPPADALTAFVREGLEADCPLAFLNLTNGRVKNLQSWHWITVTAAEAGEGTLVATASDEGKDIRLDLRLWYLSTRMHGGLIYYTEP